LPASLGPSWAGMAQDLGHHPNPILPFWHISLPGTGSRPSQWASTEARRFGRRGPLSESLRQVRPRLGSAAFEADLARDALRIPATASPTSSVPSGSTGSQVRDRGPRGGRQQKAGRFRRRCPLRSCCWPSGVARLPRPHRPSPALIFPARLSRVGRSRQRLDRGGVAVTRFRQVDVPETHAAECKLQPSGVTGRHGAPIVLRSHRD